MTEDRGLRAEGRKNIRKSGYRVFGAGSFLSLLRLRCGLQCAMNVSLMYTKLTQFDPSVNPCLQR